MTNNSITIDGKELFFDNKVEKDDVTRIRELTRDVGVFSEEEIEVSGELVLEALNDKESYHFIFLRDGQKNIVAYTCFGEICLANDRFDLYFIAVAKKWQKQQLATLILNTTAAEVKKLNGKKIYAETSSLPYYEPARGFYLKCGFTKEAEILDFYKDGDNKVIFCKNL